MYVEENLQARDLRTRLGREDNENIGQVARGHQEKQMVADGGKDTLYVVSTY